MINTSSKCSPVESAPTKHTLKLVALKVTLTLVILAIALVAVFLPITSKAYEQGSPYYLPSCYVLTPSATANVSPYEPYVTYEYSDDPEYWYTTFAQTSVAGASYVSGFSIDLPWGYDGVDIEIPSMVIGTRTSDDVGYVHLSAGSTTSPESIEYRVTYTYLDYGEPVTRSVNFGYVLDFSSALKNHIANTFLTPTYLYNVTYSVTAPDAIITSVSISFPYSTDLASTYFSSTDTDSYNQGYADGLNEGIDLGIQEGYNRGYYVGYDEGYDLGNAEGNTEGYERGYSVGKVDGYQKAIEDGADLNPFAWILNLLDSIFSFTIIPLGDKGITVGGLLAIVLAIPLIRLILDFFAGG